MVPAGFVVWELVGMLFVWVCGAVVCCGLGFVGGVGWGGGLGGRGGVE